MARRIIDQWNTKTIGGSGKLSKDDLDTVSDAIHVEESNIQNMKLVNLVGQATGTQSQSGPIGGTGQIKTAECTVSSVDVTAFTPAAGEVWQVVGISGAAAGSLTTLSGITLYVKLSSSVIIVEWSGSGSIEPPDNQFNTPLYVDENLPLIGRIYKSGGLGAGEEVTIAFAMIRVR